ncbi:MAG: cation:proton antiporter, partial [Elusimicrobia bacterium]|nr:cation:proton antiporter [Elusimicrobiota bacterium]
LLMFGVGLHFSLEDLMSVRRIAVPGAVVQIAAATAMGALAAKSWGWNFGAGLTFGLALSVASTVVLLRALEQRGMLDSVNGQIAVGWLIVEDIAMVLVLVMLPAFAGSASGEFSAADMAHDLGLTLGKVAVFVALMLAIGRKAFPRLLWSVANTGSRELFTLTVIAVALGVAYGSAKLFGVSFALGAFFAGMVMRESELSHRAAEESLPLRDAFSVLFFVSVGMLFEPSILIHQPLKVLLVLAVIIIGKSAAAFLIVIVFRYPINTALTVSASLAQIGEFSFILVGFGVSLGILPREAQSLILAGALISISLNHLVFQVVEPLQAWIRGKSELARLLERPSDPLAQLPSTVAPSHVTGHILLVGYGRVGSRIGETLLAQGRTFVVAEENREVVEGLRARGIQAVAGDASEAAVLIQAHVARARALVIATPDAPRAKLMTDIARNLNPRIKIVIRTHSEEEADLLRRESGATVLIGEHELAAGMARQLLESA